MYKHKPGIQMDVKGFNESVNITDKKIRNVNHIAYEVIEPMLWEQEKKDKNLKDHCLKFFELFYPLFLIKN